MLNHVTANLEFDQSYGPKKKRKNLINNMPYDLPHTTPYPDAYQALSSVSDSCNKTRQKMTGEEGRGGKTARTTSTFSMVSFCHHQP